MRLAGIKPGDLVEVDKRGARFYARVTVANAPGLGGISFMPLDPTRCSYRGASAREVVGIYRKAKGSA